MDQTRVLVNGVALLPDLSGAVWWPERRALAVADLHLEKGSGFAARGQLLPPYDTAATLARLEALVARLRPERVLCLGDSFHDAGAADRLAPCDAERLRALTGSCDWIWIAGNHDPAPPTAWGGTVQDAAVLDPLVFRHAARSGAAGELSGHYHPKAAVRVRGRRIAGRCFVSDGRRLILPAFGAYAGGLNVLSRTIAELLERRFVVHLLGRERLHVFPREVLAPDPYDPAHALPPRGRPAKA